MSNNFSRFSKTTILQSYSIQLALFLLTTSWVLLVGPESLGISSVFYAILALPIGVMDAGLIASVVARDNTSSKEIRAICGQQTLLGIVLGICVIVYAVLFRAFDKGYSIRLLLIIMGLAMPVISLARLRLVIFFRKLLAARLALIRWFGLLIRYLIAWGCWLIFGSLLSLAIGVAASILVENLLILMLWPNEEQVSFALPRRNELNELPDRLLGAGEQLMAELRRQLDVLVLSMFISPEFLGAYVYISRLLLQARDTVMIPLYSIMLAAYSKLNSRKLFVKKIYLEQQRLISNLVVPGLLLFGSILQYFGENLFPKIEIIVTHSILISMISAASVLSYMSVALLYGYRQFASMNLYGLLLVIALSVAYFSISYVSFEVMLSLVSAVWVSSFAFQYFFQLSKINLVDFFYYFKSAAFSIFMIFFILAICLVDVENSAVITAIISLIWVLSSIYLFRDQLKSTISKVLLDKRF